jgi:hypothetical protein
MGQESEARIKQGEGKQMTGEEREREGKSQRWTKNGKQRDTRRWKIRIKRSQRGRARKIRGKNDGYGSERSLKDQICGR